jgi:nuclear RNA export factor
VCDKRRINYFLKFLITLPHHSAMARRYPNLEVLDNEAIASITFDAPQPSGASTAATKPAAAIATSETFPTEMKPSFIAGVDPGLISQFLLRFFAAFDTNRSSLADVYHPSATFSFSANTNIPTRARIAGYQYSKEMPFQKELEWSRWLKGGHGGSRNLSRMGGGMDKMVESLHLGSAEIIKAMSDLPVTIHDVAGAPDHFIVDAWPVGEGENAILFTTVHGQFQEGLFFSSYCAAMFILDSGMCLRDLVHFFLLS